MATCPGCVLLLGRTAANPASELLLVGFWKNAWWNDGFLILGLSSDGRLPVTSPGSFVDAPSEGNSEI